MNEGILSNSRWLRYHDCGVAEHTLKVLLLVEILLFLRLKLLADLPQNGDCLEGVENNKSARYEKNPQFDFILIVVANDEI